MGCSPRFTPSSPYARNDCPNFRSLFSLSLNTHTCIPASSPSCHLSLPPALPPSRLPSHLPPLKVVLIAVQLYLASVDAVGPEHDDGDVGVRAGTPDVRREDLVSRGEGGGTVSRVGRGGGLASSIHTIHTHMDAVLVHLLDQRGTGWRGTPSTLYPTPTPT